MAQQEYYSAGYDPMILQGLTKRSSRCCAFRAVSQVGHGDADRANASLRRTAVHTQAGRVIGLRDADGDSEVYYMAQDDLERFSKLTGESDPIPW